MQLANVAAEVEAVQAYHSRQGEAERRCPRSGPGHANVHWQCFTFRITLLFCSRDPPPKLTGLWPENGQTGEFRFVTTNTSSSSCDAHTTEYNEVSARVTVRAETASKRTIAVHQSALRLIDYSANYNVFTNPTSTSISPQSRPSSRRSRRRRERGSGALLTGPAVRDGA